MFFLKENLQLNEQYVQIEIEQMGEKGRGCRSKKNAKINQKRESYNKIKSRILTSV